MDSFIDSMRSASTLVQALAASAGGLIGVFATLTVFFLMIKIANRVGKKSEGSASQK
jgi:hypothetical protein